MTSTSTWLVPIEFWCGVCTKRMWCPRKNGFVLQIVSVKVKIIINLNILLQTFFRHQNLKRTCWLDSASQVRTISSVDANENANNEYELITTGPDASTCNNNRYNNSWDIVRVRFARGERKSHFIWKRDCDEDHSWTVVTRNAGAMTSFRTIRIPQVTWTIGILTGRRCCCWWYVAM